MHVIIFINIIILPISLLLLFLYIILHLFWKQNLEFHVSRNTRAFNTRNWFRCHLVLKYVCVSHQIFMVSRRNYCSWMCFEFSINIGNKCVHSICCTSQDCDLCEIKWKQKIIYFSYPNWTSWSFAERSSVTYFVSTRAKCITLDLPLLVGSIK